eukprot:scaffold23702_cov53-Cyclotella_meneghiniana.AAC.4
MLVGATKYSNTIMVVKELNDWLLEQNLDCESSQLCVKWRNRSGRNVLILSTDPSIKQAVRELLEQRTDPLDPVNYHETYDYKFFSPSSEEDEASFNDGIKMHIEYCKQLLHVQFKGVKDDLYTATPNITKRNWVDDSTISQLLLGQDEPLFTIDKKSQFSPFLKLYRDGYEWTLLWKKENHIPTKYYLQHVFSKDLTTWTGTDYTSLKIEVPDPDEEATDEESETEPVTESDGVGQFVDEFGRTRRQTTVQDTETQMKPAVTKDCSSQTTNDI